MRAYYSPLKVFNYHDKLHALQDKNTILPPVHVYLHPTGHCNHRCAFCLTHGVNARPDFARWKESHIPWNKMQEILEDLIEMQVHAVTFSGVGEPLCYAQLPELIHKLSTQGIKVGSLSNGSLLHGAMAEAFAHKATWIRLSINAWDDASFASSRQTEHGEFSKIFHNMRTFIKLKGSCLLSVSYVTMPEAYEHLPDIIHKIHDCGVSSLRLTPMWDPQTLQLCNAAYAKHRDAIIKTVEELSSSNFAIENSLEKVDARYNNDISWCPVQQLKTCIGSNLLVYPCSCASYAVAPLGSLHDKRFKDFWYDSKEKFFKISPQLHCRDCVDIRKNKAIIEYLAALESHVEFV